MYIQYKEQNKDASLESYRVYLPLVIMSFILDVACTKVRKPKSNVTSYKLQ